MVTMRFNTLASLIVYSTRHQRQAFIKPLRGLTGTSRETDTRLQCKRSLSVESSNKDIIGVDTTKTWLVVGDGDLSYSSTIAKGLSESNIQLLATVLESEDVHNEVYKRSVGNTETILESPLGMVQFGVDATKLEITFPDKLFDCIEFNFPHWRGKTNARYNRELVDAFLQSAAKVLKKNGEIKVALCDGQGGMPVESLEKWRQSWMPAMYAATHGLMLSRIDPYDPDYSLSSHRGVDRPFNIGRTPQKYIFSFPNGKSISKDVQISCRHELRIVLEPKKLEGAASQVSFDDIVNGNAVFDFAQEFIPDGVRFEIPARELMSVNDSSRNDSQSVPLAVFLFNYSGESMPLTRQSADKIRANIEAAIVHNWGLEIAKPGRLVSRPYPYHLLPQLIKEYEV